MRAVLAVLLLLTVSAMATVPPAVPPLTFEDQDGRTLRLDALRGQVVVIVYGNRDAMDASLDWDDRMALLFGASPGTPTVVVADRQGDVRLVIVGAAEGTRWDAVADMICRLR